jgi:hypothetical protein
VLLEGMLEVEEDCRLHEHIKGFSNVHILLDGCL